jgi:hypothetical protein
MGLIHNSLYLYRKLIQTNQLDSSIHSHQLHFPNINHHFDMDLKYIGVDKYYK